MYRCRVPFSSRFKRLIPHACRDDHLGFQRMNFLGRAEASLLDKKLRREIAEYAGPKFVLYYESGGRDYSRAADAIVQSTGSFSEATVLFSFCVSGDDGTSTRRPMRRGNATEGGEPQITRSADCMKRPAIGSNRTMSSNSPRRSSLPLSLAGTLWSRQSPDDSFCSSRTTTGWKSIEVSVAGCLSGS